MRPFGISGQKGRYITDLAEKTVNREIQFKKLPAMEDTEIIEHLTQVKGVGVWTVQMFLMFALRRPDVLPTGDLGIRTSITRAYGLEAPATITQMEQIAVPWRPFRTFACWYLWRMLDGPANL